MSAQVDECCICRFKLVQKCLTCYADENIKKEDCGIAIGKCKHVYHLHCIERWLKQRIVCPLDNRKWVYEGETKKKVDIKRSLQELCCKEIAKNSQIVLQAVMSLDLKLTKNWEWINKLVLVG